MPSTTLRIAASILLISSCALAADPKTGGDAPEFKRDVLPLLKSHCVRCHGPKKQESRIRLDTLSTDLVQDRAAAEYWHEVLNVLNAGEMPPEDEKPLTAEQRKILTKWVSTAVNKAVEAQRDTSGRVVLRRLNRVEYQNTMFDLLGLDMNYSRDLPQQGLDHSRDVFHSRARIWL